MTHMHGTMWSDEGESLVRLDIELTLVKRTSMRIVKRHSFCHTIGTITLVRQTVPLSGTGSQNAGLLPQFSPHTHEQSSVYG